MLTGEQAGLLGEWRVRQAWPYLTRMDRYQNLVQMKYREYCDFSRAMWEMDARLFEQLTETEAQKLVAQP